MKGNFLEKGTGGGAGSADRVGFCADTAVFTGA